MDVVEGTDLRGPGMTTADIFRLADACIEVGFFSALTGRHYVLGLDIPGTERAIIHRQQVSFRLHCPCRVWLMSGRIRVLLGDSHALPASVDENVRPPFTG